MTALVDTAVSWHLTYRYIPFAWSHFCHAVDNRDSRYWYGGMYCLKSAYLVWAATMQYGRKALKNSIEYLKRIPK